MKFEIGQIVTSATSTGATWQFIIVGAFKKRATFGEQYYKCYCFKNPYHPSNRRDLYKVHDMSETLLNEV